MTHENILQKVADREAVDGHLDLIQRSFVPHFHIRFESLVKLHGVPLPLMSHGFINFLSTK